MAGPCGILAESRAHGPRPRTKITFRQLRKMGVAPCFSDDKCSHATASSGDQSPDDVRLSDIEPLFICHACGKRGADVRPDFHRENEPRLGKCLAHGPTSREG